MVKPPKKPKPKPKPEEIETHPDGWERFQRTMNKILPPKKATAKKDDGDAKG